MICSGQKNARNPITAGLVPVFRIETPHLTENIGLGALKAKNTPPSHTIIACLSMPVPAQMKLIPSRATAARRAETAPAPNAGAYDGTEQRYHDVGKSV
jgi:hypothetical protein